MPPIVWTPSPERIASATITRYREWLNETRSLGLDGYPDLWQWSVDELEAFWTSIWEFFEVDASEPYERVLTRREMPGAEWFPGARLSYAEHIFRGRDDAEVAIRHASELRPLGEWTWCELRQRAGAVAGVLREAGVEPGDRVAAYLPNIPETVAAFLGCASIGATWSSCAPEFGVRSVVDRFAQIEPKVLLAVDGYRYGGRDFDRSDAIAALQRELPTVERTFVLPYLAGGDWELPPAELDFAQLPFDHPLWVLYSSGTTGLPKAIVHGQGGILLEHLKKLRLHLDEPGRRPGRRRRRLRRLPAPLPDQPGHDVAGDGQQPGQHRRVTPEPGQRPDCPHPRLLGRLVGQVAVAGQVVGEAPHRRLELPDELPQGVTVAPGGPRRQLLHVSHRNRHHTG